MRPPRPRDPIGASQWREHRVQNIARANAALRSHAVTGPRPPSEERAAYDAIATRLPPGQHLACGIDRTGCWAQIGDQLCYAQPTPVAALRGVWTMWEANNVSRTA